MNSRKTNEKGFTLIEIVVTLLLVGITAALAGMWIISVTNGYIFTRNNMETTQKAQLAMTRLVKEFKAITAVGSNSANSISYTRSDIALGSVTSTVALSGSELQLNGNALADNVNEFTLRYCDHVADAANATNAGNNCSAGWTSTSRLIFITLKLTGAGNVVSTFTDNVAPRNM